MESSAISMDGYIKNKKAINLTQIINIFNDVLNKILTRFFPTTVHIYSKIHLDVHSLKTSQDNSGRKKKKWQVALNYIAIKTYFKAILIKTDIEAGRESEVNGTERGALK